MPLTIPDGLVVSVSGFRGRVGDPLTPELVCALASAFGAFLEKSGRRGDVLIGRDTRTSGRMLANAAASGLVSVGRNVVDLGVVATPTLMLAVGRDEAAGGIAVTASHNPSDWNALKLAAPEGTFLDADAMRAFLDFALGDEVRRAPWDALGIVREDRGAADRHLRAVLGLPQLDVRAIRERGFSVALDCVRGAGATLLPPLLEALGCRVRAIHTEMDGRFPRDPEPTAENLRELGDLVRRERADLGLAVDPDVDRLSLVDEGGEALGEDLTLALAAAAVLRRSRGTVVTNFSTSQAVDDVAAAYQSPLVRAPVGEINVARCMQAEGAVVGGEGNGGVILPALHQTRDAAVAAALILQNLVDEGASLSEAAGRWPSYAIIKRKLSFPRASLADAYQALEQDLEGEGVDRSDGLRLSWSGRRSWLHVRPSGTEPVVRLIAEAPEREGAEALIRRASRVLEGVVEVAVRSMAARPRGG